MKRIAIALAASFLLVGVAQAADGKALFASKCAACHGPDGKGQNSMGKKLGVKDLTATKLSATDLETTITAGKAGTQMKGFGGKMSAEEIKAVAHFVKGGLK